MHNNFGYNKDPIVEFDILSLRYVNEVKNADDEFRINELYNNSFYENKDESSKSNRNAFIKFINTLIESFKRFHNSIMDKLLKSKNKEIDEDRVYLDPKECEAIQNETEKTIRQSDSLIRKILNKTDVGDSEIDAIVNTSANVISRSPQFILGKKVTYDVSKSNERLYMHQNKIDKDLCSLGELSKKAYDERIDDYQRNRIQRIEKATHDLAHYNLEGFARTVIGLPAHQTKVYKIGDTYHFNKK